MNHTPEPTHAAPVPQQLRRPACNWCTSSHVADAECTCQEPCKSGWCPADATSFIH